MSLGKSEERKALMAWAVAGRIPAERLEEALLLSGLHPDLDAWRRFGLRLAFLAGAVLVAAGVIFFFAYNWAAMPRWAKFALAEAALVAATLAALRLGLETLPGRAALLGATVLLGAALALYGQIYQTGADTWQLFATWAVLAAPWVIAARWSVLWLSWLLLLNLATGLYFSLFGPMWGWVALFFGPQTVLWALFFLDTAALALWEAAARAGWPAAQSLWALRLVAWGAGGCATVLGVWGVLDRRAEGAMILAYLAWMAAAWGWYRFMRRDLLVLAGWILSATIFVATILGKSVIRGDAPGGYFLVSLAVLAMAVAGGRWLHNLAAAEGAKT